MNCCIISLPKDVLYLIANFLTKSSVQAIFPFSNDWRNFVNTSKEHFGEWKKDCQLIVLKLTEANEFKKNSRFREMVLQGVVDPSEQLDLQFHFSSQQFEIVGDLGSFGNVRKISAEQCRITNFPSVFQELSLIECELETVANLPPLRYVHIASCSLPQYSEEIDLSDMTILEWASFVHMDLENYHTLSHLKWVSISYCSSITDVSCFSACESLFFTNCNEITDVSPLQNVRTLELSDCDGVAEVSSLGKVYDLNLEKCVNITDVSALKNVHFLNLSYCSLKNVHTLYFKAFQGNDVSGLEHVVCLCLQNSPNVDNITMQLKLRDLDVSNCPMISDFHGLHNLKYLSIGREADHWENLPASVFPIFSSDVEKVLEQLTRCALSRIVIPTHTLPICETNTETNLSFEHFGQIRYLILCDCVFVGIPEKFVVHLHYLSLTNCSQFAFLPELPSLGYLRIYRCHSLKDLHLSGPKQKYPIYTVDIWDCKTLTRIDVTRKISDMEITDCSEFSHLVVKSRIRSLKIEKCPKLKSFNCSGQINYLDSQL
jgi:hypothetical protein